MITCSIFLFSNCKDAFCFLFVYVVRCIQLGCFILSIIYKTLIIKFLGNFQLSRGCSCRTAYKKTKKHFPKFFKFLDLVADVLLLVLGSSKSSNSGFKTTAF